MVLSALVINLKNPKESLQLINLKSCNMTTYENLQILKNKMNRNELHSKIKVTNRFTIHFRRLLISTGTDYNASVTLYKH